MLMIPSPKMRPEARTTTVEDAASALAVASSADGVSPCPDCKAEGASAADELIPSTMSLEL